MSERCNNCMMMEKLYFDAKANNDDQVKAIRTLQAEVERLRMEFRRIEECAAAMLAGERCYAQVMKLLHEAPRAALARR